MCDAGQCVPPPCQPHPWVAGNLTCSCNLTNITTTPGICQEGQLCHTTCITPIYCPDPTSQQDWTSRHALLTNITTNITNTTFIQWSSIELECEEHRFTAELEAGFTATCQEENGGTWNFSTCSYPVCEEVEVDTDSVEVRELFIIGNTTTQGAILKFSCKDDAAVFSIGSGLTRILAHCNRR